MVDTPSTLSTCARIPKCPAALPFLAVALLAGGPSSAEGSSRDTFVFKNADSLKLEMDVYRAQGEGLRPVVLWIHGGALMFGNRTDIEYPFAAALLSAGCTVASIDYRLAPEAKLPDILEDVRDAYTWICAEGPRRFSADPERVLVAGASAGGYLALMAGVMCRPRPRALAAYYGYGDIVGPWLSEPSKHYRRVFSLIDEADARGQVSTMAMASGDPQSRGRFYVFCRQQGVWPNQILGRDPLKEPEVFTPYLPLKQIGLDWPPTILIHGEVDHDVPADQSRLAALALEKAGVKHKLLLVSGADHGLANASEAELQEVHTEAVAFVLDALR